MCPRPVCSWWDSRRIVPGCLQEVSSVQGRGSAEGEGLGPSQMGQGCSGRQGALKRRLPGCRGAVLPDATLRMPAACPPVGVGVGEPSARGISTPAGHMETPRGAGPLWGRERPDSGQTQGPFPATGLLGQVLGLGPLFCLPVWLPAALGAPLRNVEANFLTEAVQNLSFPLKP